MYTFIYLSMDSEMFCQPLTRMFQWVFDTANFHHLMGIQPTHLNSDCCKNRWLPSGKLTQLWKITIF